MTPWLALINGSDSLLDLPTIDPIPFHAACQGGNDRIQFLTSIPAGESKRGGWSDTTWRIFFKKRAEELGVFRVFGPRPLPIYLETTLHVAFVGVVETSEHLTELLRVSFEEIEARDNTARSKIGTTQLVIQPIDRVAARVV